MLRITCHCEENGTTLELEGRLAGAWVTELQRVWRETEQTGKRPIVVNLAAVSYVDADGKRLLSDMCRAGIGFEASGCLMRWLVDDMTRTCHRGTGTEPGRADEDAHEGT